LDAGAAAVAIGNFSNDSQQNKMISFGGCEMRLLAKEKYHKIRNEDLPAIYRATFCRFLVCCFFFVIFLLLVWL